MKFRYVLVITFITFNTGFAYELYIKPENKIHYVQKKEYKKLINKANVLAMQNRPDESLKIAKQAYITDKTRKDALLIMARIYNFKKDYLNLRKTAEKILKISPENYLGNIYLSNSYVKSDKIKARKILENLLKKYKDDVRIKEKLKELNV